MKLSVLSDLLLREATCHDFAGADPFDGLNSRFFDLFPALRKSKLGLAWIQLHKRLPVNLRGACLVPKKRNPKGVALFILGMLEDFYRNQDQSVLRQATELGDWLLTQQSSKDDWQHACWGYHFDWNARAFFVPKGKPNVITTIYVAQALYALYQKTGVEIYRDTAFDAAHFIVKTLYTESEGRKFFAYIPGENAFVHNASLWGAAWVATVAAQTSNTEYGELARTVARQSVSEQAVDGSWVYGARHHHQFIDGFHTGYNLEALHVLSLALDTDEFAKSIQIGLQYYRDNFFDNDGAAKYYHNNRYPLDMHSVAQAVFTLLRVGGTREDLLLADKVIKWSLQEMYIPSKNQFYYQRTQKISNSINYIRWTQAWVYYAFAFYSSYQERNADY